MSHPGNNSSNHYYATGTPSYTSNNYSVPYGSGYPPHPQAVPQNGPVPSYPPNYYPHNAYPGAYPQYASPFSQWIPTPKLDTQISFWFSEIDVQQKGSIGGAEAVQFFNRSKLAKDILREIWALVDYQKTGRLDRYHFSIAVRMLCILCNPAYVSFKPSVDLFNGTISMDFPIPDQLYHPTQQVSPVPSAGISPVTSSVNLSSSQSIPTSTNHHAPFQTQPINQSLQPSHINSTNFNAQIPAEEDEFSDFSSAQTHSIPAVTVLPISQASTTTFPQSSHPSQASLVAVSDIADDEFSDFASAPSLSPKIEEKDKFQFHQTLSNQDVHTSQQIKATSNVISDLNFDDEDQDEFEDFQVSPKVDHHQILPPPSNHVASSISTMDFPENEFDDIDDFQQAPVPSSIPESTSNQSLSHQPIFAHRANDKLSVFDELVENDLKEQAINNEDWDDFAEAQPQSSAATETDSAPQLLLEPDLLTISAPIESFPQQTHISNHHEFGEENEFGEFEEADFNVAIHHNHEEEFDIKHNNDSHEDLFAEHTTTVTINNSTPFDNIHNENVTSAPNIKEIKFDDDEEEFDDFGDFETHSPVPTSTSASNLEFEAEFSQPESTIVSELTLDPSPASNAISTIDLLDLDTPVSESPAFDPFSHTSAPKKETSSNELDLLSLTFEPSPVPVSSQFNFFVDPFAPASVSQPTNSTTFEHDDEEEFGDFDGFTADFENATIENTIPPTNENIIDPFSEKPSEDPFAIPQSTPIEVKAIISVAPTPKISVNFSTKVSLPSNSQESNKPMNLDEIEKLFSALIQGNCYEEAYECLQQYQILLKIHIYNELKKKAMDDDELEEAVKYKKLANELLSSLLPIQQEKFWKLKGLTCIGNNKQSSIVELYQSIEMINQKYANEFTKRFSSCFTNSFSILSYSSNDIKINTKLIQDYEMYLKQCIIAKRCARIMITVCTSHQEYPHVWTKLITLLLTKLQEFQTILSGYQQLSSTTKESTVNNNQKWKDYLQNIKYLLDMSIWIMVSCEEICMQSNELNDLRNLTNQLSSILKNDWQIQSEIESFNSFDEIIFKTGLKSELSNIVYCNISLRPLLVKSQDSLTFYPHYLQDHNLYYSKPLLNIWKHDISPNIPQGDCEFA